MYLRVFYVMLIYSNCLFIKFLYNLSLLVTTLKIIHRAATDTDYKSIKKYNKKHVANGLFSLLYT